MRRNGNKSWVYVPAIVCTMLAPFFFWPLGLLGIFVAAFMQLPVLAVVLGLVLDVVYGSPPASFHFVLFPFTLFAVLAVLVRTFANRYVVKRRREDVL